VSYNRQTYYYVDNVTNNVAQYKLQNYNCIVTLLDKHVQKMHLLKNCSYNCSPCSALKNTTVQFSGDELFSAAMKHESLRR